jgi:hypothetical protein
MNRTRDDEDRDRIEPTEGEVPPGWGEVRRELDQLPREVRPPRDLWAGVQARIEAGEGRRTSPVGAQRSGRPQLEVADGGQARMSPRRGPTPRRRSGRHGFEPPRAVGWRSGLAGVLTMAAAAAAVFFWPNGAPPSLPTPAGQGSTAGAPATETESAPLFAAEASGIEDAYGPAIQELQLLLASQDLAPETRAVLDENLAVIEGAIRESREAVAADPGASTTLTGLRNLYDAKVHLLRTVAVQH